MVQYQQFQETRYFRALDGLRAVSILLVMVHHSNSSLWRHVNGGLGVVIFFVISGFLITTLALREEARIGALSLRAFYIRRVCRIFPLYYTVLLVYIVVVIGANYHQHRQLLVDVLPYYLFYMNDFAPTLGMVPFNHSWSLGVEEKFYLLWPVLAFGLWRARPSLRFPCTAALIFVPFLLDQVHALPFDVQVFDQPLYYSYAAILVGCLLAFALHDRAAYARLVRVASGVPAFLTLGVFLAAHALVETRAWILFAYPFAVALAMVPILIGNTPWVRGLGTAPMVFIGIRSYGVYLVHMICLSVVVAIARDVPGFTIDSHGRPIGDHSWEASLLILGCGFASSLLLATGLNVAIERPFIVLGRRLTRAVTGAEPVGPPRMADTARPVPEVSSS